MQTRDELPVSNTFSGPGTAYGREMADRDDEKDVTIDYFVDTPQRLAEAIESGESFRIQLAERRVTVSAGAVRVDEHDVSDPSEELAHELSRTNAD